MKKLSSIFAFVAVLFAFSACNNSQEVQLATAETDTTAVIIQSILNRTSVRQYTSQSVGDDTIQQILRAGMAAPTARDVRPWHFIVITDKQRVPEIFAGNFNLEKYQQAAAVIIVCADTICTLAPMGQPDAPAESRPNTMWRDDAAAATENICLAAEAFGLGAVWTACYPDYARMAPIRAALNIPENVMPYAVVPIGHPAEPLQPKNKWNESRIHNDKW